jgi:hypothetical protein
MTGIHWIYFNIQKTVDLGEPVVKWGPRCPGAFAVAQSSDTAPSGAWYGAWYAAAEDAVRAAEEASKCAATLGTMF